MRCTVNILPIIVQKVINTIHAILILGVIFSASAKADDIDYDIRTCLSLLVMSKAMNDSYLMEKYDKQAINDLMGPGNYKILLNDYEYIGEKGNSDAQYLLGNIYEYGKCGEKNGEKAVYWYKKVANNLSSAAQYKVGYIYLKGIDVKVDVDKALHYLQLSAQKNYPKAQFLLGQFYFDGTFVEKDVVQGYVWMAIAAQNKSSGKYIELRDKYLASLSQEQLNKSVRLIEKWQFQH